MKPAITMRGGQSEVEEGVWNPRPVLYIMFVRTCVCINIHRTRREVSTRRPFIFLLLYTLSRPCRLFIYFFKHLYFIFYTRSSCSVCASLSAPHMSSSPPRSFVHKYKTHARVVGGGGLACTGRRTTARPGRLNNNIELSLSQPPPGGLDARPLPVRRPAGTGRVTGRRVRGDPVGGRGNILYARVHYADGANTTSVRHPTRWTWRGGREGRVEAPPVVWFCRARGTRACVQ